MAPNTLDAHTKPPDKIRQVYKKHQKADVKNMDIDGSIVDTASLCTGRVPQQPEWVGSRPFLQHLSLSSNDHTQTPFIPTAKPGIRNVYEAPHLPGLFLYPSFIPDSLQLGLLDDLLHHDLSNPAHKTNVHMHYDVPYPPEMSSFFDLSAKDLAFDPKDPTLHKPITTQQFLNKKLRWMTLGGQYDWTNKVYPEGPPPPFPPSTKNLVEHLFPMKAEAAIVNLYSPGDTLSLHRDVAESCDQPLVSISLGCDGIFVIGLEAVEEGAPHGEPRVVVLRLRSGDAVLMSGESRYAWHGVPKVVEGSCPDWMQDWPGEQYPEWKGWMKGKRVNLNVRQMFD